MHNTAPDLLAAGEHESCQQLRLSLPKCLPLPTSGGQIKLAAISLC